jgi:hypothetical protein
MQNQEVQEHTLLSRGTPTVADSLSQRGLKSFIALATSITGSTSPALPPFFGSALGGIFWPTNKPLSNDYK